MIKFCFLVFATALTAGNACAADWWQFNALSMPARPEAGHAVLQNPPVLSWPIRYSAVAYEVKLNSGTGGTQNFTTNGNWLNLKSPLLPGNYTWSVRALGSGSTPLTVWSTERSFSVNPSSQIFIAPDATTHWNKAAQTAHPRGFPRDAELITLKNNLTTTRKADLDALKTRLLKKTGASLIVEPTQTFSLIENASSRAETMGDLRNALTTEQETVLGLGLLWHIEKNPLWLSEAKRRTLNLAQWNPDGSTGLVSHNQATRTIMLTVAIGYDWFYNEWTPSERKILLNSIKKRYDALYTDIVEKNALANSPYNPWASYTLGYLTAVAPLIAGDAPETEASFKTAFSLYAAIFPAWSSDDGGYANGTAYGVWDVPESILLWDLMKWASGLNFYHKPSVENFGTFMAYFLPPGAPLGVFGDGAEIPMASSIARYGKAFAGRVNSPMLAWYSSQLLGEDKTSFSVLTTLPSTANSNSIPANTPNSKLFPAIGWAAFHSNLSDRGRFSVYFKSSPFGSLNHSHADQNSFVIHSEGRVLAMDSGTYDYYNSPHWRDWYKQTRAHNAITFDGGRGQGLGELGTGSKALNGQISKFSTSIDYDMVIGDATNAYQGELTMAKRWLVFLRPSTVVVVDQLKSLKQRTWEWNFHTSAKPVLENGGYAFGESTTGACLRVSSPAKLTYKVNEGYSPPPVTTATVGNHFWSQFAYFAPSNDGVFISVISDNCSDVSQTATWANGKGQVMIGSKRITFTGSDVLVQ